MSKKPAAVIQKELQRQKVLEQKAERAWDILYRERPQLWALEAEGRALQLRVDDALNELRSIESILSKTKRPLDIHIYIKMLKEADTKLIDATSLLRNSSANAASTRLKMLKSNLRKAEKELKDFKASIKPIKPSAK